MGERHSDKHRSTRPRSAKRRNFRQIKARRSGRDGGCHEIPVRPPRLSAVSSKYRTRTGVETPALHALLDEIRGARRTLTGTGPPCLRELGPLAAWPSVGGQIVEADPHRQRHALAGNDRLLIAQHWKRREHPL